MVKTIITPKCWVCISNYVFTIIRFFFSPRDNVCGSSGCKVQSNVDLAELLKIFYTHGAFTFIPPSLHLDFIITFLKNENQLQC